MSIIDSNIITNSNYIILNKRYFLFIYFLFISQFKEILLNYFENNMQVGILSTQASLIDITDYHKLYLLITTEKKIYTGMPPTQKSVTTSNIISITAAATYDTNYALLACTEDYFLSKININTGVEVPLINYTELNLSIENLNYTCSISILNNIVYIGIAQILDNVLKQNAIKIGLDNSNENNGPILGNKIIKYTFDVNLTNLGDLIYPRLLSCEVISRISNISSPRLVCGYLIYDSLNKLYRYYANVTNKDFTGFSPGIRLFSSSSLLSFRLQKINSTFIRYLLSRYSYEIYINGSSYTINNVKTDLRNPYLYTFFSLGDSFYYHNRYIFSTYPTDTNKLENFYIYFKSNISDSYIRFIEKKKYIHKCIGYYDEFNDKLEIIYQYANNIKYIIVQNMNDLFYFQCETKTIEALSNQNIIFNVSELITYPLEHKKLHKFSMVNYVSTKEQNWSYTHNKINFDMILKS